MKYYTRLKQYKASNVMFDCETQIATSYDWWQFYKKGVFNNAYVSNTTNRHQSKMRDVLKQANMGILIELTRTKLSLANLDAAFADEILLFKQDIEVVKSKLNKLKNKEGKRGVLYREDITNMSIDLKNLKESIRNHKESY